MYYIRIVIQQYNNYKLLYLYNAFQLKYIKLR